MRMLSINRKVICCHNVWRDVVVVCLCTVSGWVLLFPIYVSVEWVVDVVCVTVEGCVCDYDVICVIVKLCI
jgi:hypothetical protein